ncbi:hypothetical protein ASD79_02205 [Caulobacter sp. Root655]|uniref:DUF6445 family protein n=1 Tax=Caulobacter sp. Root655 TaxID=1736578 RepID=UPI0006FF5D81|nr:DUF6445 family protein [Caulobacter sp. Root655]KRA66118.1 hypothetical protein ASD79_02205 [Caulobacter sp. Root655]
MSEPAFDAAQDPHVEVLRVGAEQHPVLLVDGLLIGVEGLVDFAADTAVLAPVKSAANFYPGVRAPAPGGYVRALIKALRPHLAQMFGAPIGGQAHITSALSMATLPVQAANLAQRLPHIDTTQPNQLAILHYLCGPEHGGTAFYRHRATGFEAIGPDRGPAYFAALRDEIAGGEASGGYIVGSSDLFEQTAAVTPVFNRVIVYASNLLHAGVLPDRPLSQDPRLGRLTANTFFRFEPR